jgi:hypothetical protein
MDAIVYPSAGCLSTSASPIVWIAPEPMPREAPVTSAILPARKCGSPLTDPSNRLDTSAADWPGRRR